MLEDDEGAEELGEDAEDGGGLEEDAVELARALLSAAARTSAALLPRAPCTPPPSARQSRAYRR